MMSILENWTPEIAGEVMVIPPVEESEFGTVTYADFASVLITQDITTEDQMRAVEDSGVLDFWNHPDEDVYTESDGDAV